MKIQALQPIRHYTEDMANTKQRVLIIEHDRNLARSISSGVAAEGLEVMVAYDGNQGLAMCLTKQPDIMVMNLRLPRRSGFLILEHLRRHTEVDCPIIVIADNQGMRHRHYTQWLGVADYFCTPIDIDVLVGRIVELLKASVDKDQFPLNLLEH